MGPPRRERGGSRPRATPASRGSSGGYVDADEHVSGALRGECKRFGTEVACESNPDATPKTLDAVKDIFRTDQVTAQYQGGKLKSFRESFTSSSWTDHLTTYLPSGRVQEIKATPAGTVGALSQDWSEYFAYNGIGNIDQVTVSRNTSTSPANARPDVSAVEKYNPAGSTTALLDRVSSITATGTPGKTASTTTYGYDLLGHLTQVTRSPGESETLYYAPGGELLFRQIGERFVFYVGEYATVTARGTAGCGSSCAPQAATVELDAHVVFAGTRIASAKPSRTLFYYRTRLGSVIATSLSGGVRGAAYRYSPYGEVELVTNETDATRSELGYTNAVRLTGSLLHLKNRVYDPEARLFIQADVVDRLRYAYVAGDPVNASDPTGLMARYETLDGMQLTAAPDDASVADQSGWGEEHAGAGASNLPQSGAAKTESAGEATQTALQQEQPKLEGEAQRPGALESWAHFNGERAQFWSDFSLDSRNRPVERILAKGLVLAFSAFDSDNYRKSGVVAAVGGAGAAYSLGSLALSLGPALPALGQRAAEAMQRGSSAASNAVQGALFRAQLAAEQVARARLPQTITGFTRHGLNQAISRDSVGVSTRAMMDAFQNPQAITGQPGGVFMMVGRNAVVIVNSAGRVITTWATNSAGTRTP